MRLRGKPFRDLSLEWSIKLGAALGRLAGEGGLVVSGRDMLPVSRMFKRAITAGVMSAGAEVMDFHESLTGEISFAIKRFGGRAGFMVSNDPLEEGNIVIRIYKSPGYEVVGKELESFLGDIEKGVGEPRRVGWVNYAEYMHRVYTTAISSFVKSDTISSAGIKAIAGPGLDPLDGVLRDLSSELGVEQTVIGVSFKACLHPLVELMSDVEKVASAVRATLGAVFSHDGSALTVYTAETGYLLHGELALILAERYPSDSKVLALNPVQKTFTRVLENRGFDIIVVNTYEDYSSVLRRERPVIAFTYAGDVISTVFSLGSDAVVAYAQLLEVVSDLESNKLKTLVKTELRDKAVFVNYEDAMKLCHEKGFLTLSGCTVMESGKVVSLVYQPSSGGFLAVTDEVAPATLEHRV